MPQLLGYRGHLQLLSAASRRISAAVILGSSSHHYRYTRYQPSFIHACPEKIKGCRDPPERKSPHDAQELVAGSCRPVFNPFFWWTPRRFQTGKSATANSRRSARGRGKLPATCTPHSSQRSRRNFASHLSVRLDRVRTACQLGLCKNSAVRFPSPPSSQEGRIEQGVPADPVSS